MKNYPCKSFGLWLLQKSPDIDVCEEADTGRVGKQINSTLQDRVQENIALEIEKVIQNARTWNRLWSHKFSNEENTN